MSWDERSFGFDLERRRAQDTTAEEQFWADYAAVPLDVDERAGRR